MLKSIGRWFESGSKELFFFSSSSLSLYPFTLPFSLCYQSISEAHEASAQEGDTSVSFVVFRFICM